MIANQNLWLIHGEVWQKTTKSCKAIVLQLKKKKEHKLYLLTSPGAGLQAHF